MNVVSGIAFAAVGLAGMLCVLRIIRGPSLADRIVASDTLVLVVVSGLGVSIVQTRSGTYVTLLVVMALVGFAGTAFLARFIEARGTDGD